MRDGFSLTTGLVMCNQMPSEKRGLKEKSLGWLPNNHENANAIGLDCADSTSLAIAFVKPASHFWRRRNTEEFELGIMIANATEEMDGSD